MNRYTYSEIHHSSRLCGALPCGQVAEAGQQGFEDLETDIGTHAFGAVGSANRGIAQAQLLSARIVVCVCVYKCMCGMCCVYMRQRGICFAMVFLLCAMCNEVEKKK